MIALFLLLDLSQSLDSNLNPHLQHIGVFCKKLITIKTLKFYNIDKDTKEVTVKWKHRLQDILKYLRHLSYQVKKDSITIFILLEFNRVDVMKLSLTNLGEEDPNKPKAWVFFIGK